MKKGLGQHGELVSLPSSEVTNWSRLVDKCMILLSMVERFERRLRPATPGVDGSDI